MAAHDWEEIKRLAADFQRAQLSSTAHKLSERNCIEIVNKLVQIGLIEVIYTIDGKEYLTPNHLEREIRDELTVHGGRINLVDLQQILNVDLSHIESKVHEIVRGDRHFCLIQGQLLDRDYLDRTAEEINETLQEAGQVTVANLAKTFNLPTDFLLSVIESRLGNLIHGQLDPINRDVLFTAAFIARNIAKIRGIFSAITRPTYVIQLVAQYGLPEKLFFTVLQTLVESHRLAGSVQGRQDKAVYVPEIYSRTQANYIDSFFQQNSYIEYQALSRLGITDGRQYLKKRYTGKDYMFLPTCCISSTVIGNVDAAIEEALTNNHWIDIKPIVPSPFTAEDINMVLQHCVKDCSRTTAIIFCQSIVASVQYVSKCKAIFEPLMNSKANKDVKLSPALFADLTRKEKVELTESATGDGKQAKKDERQKKALSGGGQKGGGGRGARESSTKKTKNKYRERMKGNQDDDVDDDILLKKVGKQQEIPFMSENEIFEILKKEVKECDDDEFLQEIASSIHRPLTRDYQEIAKSIFLASTCSSASVMRKSHQDYEEKLNGLWQNIKLFEKGLNLFQDETRVQLCKYLLKSVASDFVNIIFEKVANENLMSLGDNEILTSESRLKLLNKLPDEWKSVLTKLNNSLIGKDLDDFTNAAERVTSPEYCDIVLKKVDKKKERQLLFNHRQVLIDQLNHETEPAMALHLASVILFQYYTNTLLHAPGRLVPQIIAYIENNISTNDFKTLSNYQNLVIEQILKSRNPSESENHMADMELNQCELDRGKSTAVLLAEGLSSIKSIVANMKKSTAEE